MPTPVLIETPFSGHGLEGVRYLFCALLDSVLRGEAPIASHAIYPLCLPEHSEAYEGHTGREIGLMCRDAIATLARPVRNIGEDTSSYWELDVIGYADLGVTPGMRREVVPVTTWRVLSGEAKRMWDSGEWPSNTRWATTNE